MPYYDMPTVTKPPEKHTHVRFYSFDYNMIVETIVSGHLNIKQAWKVARHGNFENILSSYTHVTTTVVRVEEENV